MSVTLRSTKGSALTHVEMDANFSGLADGSNWATSLTATSNITLTGTLATSGNISRGSGTSLVTISANAINLGGAASTISNSSSFLTVSSAQTLVLSSAAGSGIELRSNGSGTPGLTLASAGTVTIANLAGSGSRTVVADANGVLSAP